MTWLITTFLNFLSGGVLNTLTTTISTITSQIANEKLALINAKTEAERIASQERINALQAQASVLIADVQKSPVDLYVRAAFAVCALLVVAKILVWDKVIGSFVGCSGKAGSATACHVFLTDSLSSFDVMLIGVIIGFYFVTKPK
jgi:hypothetical protein